MSLEKTETSSDLMSRADFAAAQGWHRSHVTRLAGKGRIVFDVTGDQICVSATRALLTETRGGRGDVKDRHQKNRQQSPKTPSQGAASAPPAPPPPPAAAQPLEGDGLVRGSNLGNQLSLSKATSDARLAKAKADSAEMEAAKMAGSLLEKEDAEAAMRSVAAAVRAEFERFPDQHAPALAAMADPEEVRAYLKAACEQAQRGLSQAIARERDEMTKATA
jgi:hypothetical protein